MIALDTNAHREDSPLHDAAAPGFGLAMLTGVSCIDIVLVLLAKGVVQPMVAPVSSNADCSGQGAALDWLIRSARDLLLAACPPEPARPPLPCPKRSSSSPRLLPFAR